MTASFSSNISVAWNFASSRQDQLDTQTCSICCAAPLDLVRRVGATYLAQMPGKLSTDRRRDRSDAHGNRAGLQRRDLLLATGVCILLSTSAFARPVEARRFTLKNMHTGETFSGPYRDATGPLPSPCDRPLGLSDPRDERAARGHHIRGCRAQPACRRSSDRRYLRP